MAESSRWVQISFRRRQRSIHSGDGKTWWRCNTCRKIDFFEGWQSFLLGAAPLFGWNAIVIAQGYLSASSYGGFPPMFLSLSGLAQNLPSLVVMATLSLSGGGGGGGRAGNANGGAAGGGAGASSSVLLRKVWAVYVPLFVLASISAVLGALVISRRVFTPQVQAVVWCLIALNGLATGAATAELFAAVSKSDKKLSLMIGGAGLGALAPSIYEISLWYQMEFRTAVALLFFLSSASTAAFSLAGARHVLSGQSDSGGDQLEEQGLLQASDFVGIGEGRGRSENGKESIRTTDDDTIFSSAEGRGTLVSTPQSATPLLGKARISSNDPRSEICGRLPLSVWLDAALTFFTESTSIATLGAAPLVPINGLTGLSTYLIAGYNLGDLVGRQIAARLASRLGQSSSRLGLVIAATLRAALLLLGVPVLVARGDVFKGEWVLSIAVFILVAATNGLLVVALALQAQNNVTDTSSSATAAKVCATAMQLGIVGGFCLAFAVSPLAQLMG